MSWGEEVVDRKIFFKLVRDCLSVWFWRYNLTLYVEGTSEMGEDAQHWSCLLCAFALGVLQFDG